MREEKNKLVITLIVIGAISLMIGSFTIGQYLVKENIFNIFGGTLTEKEDEDEDEVVEKTTTFTNLTDKIVIYVEGEKTELEAKKISSKLGYEMTFSKDRINYSNVDGADRFSFYITTNDMYLEVKCITDDTYENLTNNLLNPTTVLIGKNDYSAKQVTSTTGTGGSAVLDKLYYVKYQSKTYIIKTHYVMEAADGMGPLFGAMVDSFVLVGE